VGKGDCQKEDEKIHMAKIAIPKPKNYAQLLTDAANPAMTSASLEEIYFIQYKI
jgi:hypothetical protein